MSDESRTSHCVNCVCFVCVCACACCERGDAVCMLRVGRGRVCAARGERPVHAVRGERACAWHAREGRGCVCIFKNNFNHLQLTSAYERHALSSGIFSVCQSA